MVRKKIKKRRKKLKIRNKSLGKKPDKLKSSAYSAKDIDVLEGLDPVKKRPAMYIGNTSTEGLHHLASEILDNAMDEAVDGHASKISVNLQKNNLLAITDDGRGIPVDKHPKLKKSALEVILTTLHSGGKFKEGVYRVSGGLHGVGLSVVNALSSFLEVQVFKKKFIYSQKYKFGKPVTKLKKTQNRKKNTGTRISFQPDKNIFSSNDTFNAQKIYEMAKTKAYLFGGTKISWSTDCKLDKKTTIPKKEEFYFPEGIKDYIKKTTNQKNSPIDKIFYLKKKFEKSGNYLECAISWIDSGNNFLNSYCNTIPTPLGGTHEIGFRSGILRGLKSYASLSGNKKAQKISSEDISYSTGIILSLFITNPQFQGQTKEKLASAEATKIVENAVKEGFEQWLTDHPRNAKKILELTIELSELRLLKRQDQEIERKTFNTKIKLPGKLTDCANSSSSGTELFVVEGDSAGGSAKQARNRKTQAILPLRGKILNVLNATSQKISANQEISDLITAIGTFPGDRFVEQDMRYEKVIIMTDADIDGAHIAALLIAFFYSKMPKLIEKGHLYLAVPPLYRISKGSLIEYAINDKHREQIIKTIFKKFKNVEISRFKGLGEMMPEQLKKTTMDPENRYLIRVCLPSSKLQKNKVMRSMKNLMGKNAELRAKIVQTNAKKIKELRI